MILAEQILELINRKGKVEITDIQDKFKINRATAYAITYFLIRFGFAEWDKKKKYVSLSKAYRKFLKDIDT